MTQADLELHQQFEESERELSPALQGYVERRVSLATARTNERQPDWVGDFIYVQELAGELTVRLGNVNAPPITLREGDLVKSKFQQVYLTNRAMSAWGTAVLLIGLGDFQVQPASGNRTPVVVYTATAESGALDLATDERRRFRLLYATVHFDTAPAADEDLTLRECHKITYPF